ncbi:MAG: hypothetical protein JWR77_559 [Rhizorhabdus sp.]|nr:hypothetical protein [Rhizorhabdus sp.]
MVTAPVRAGRIAPLRALLATMNIAPGVVDPENALLPFAHFTTIHVARLLILDDPTLPDRAIYPGLPDSEPVYLSLQADCDGPADALIDALAASPGLRAIFAHCEGFDTNTDLAAWMRARHIPAATAYTNGPGRSLARIREEAALHDVLRASRLSAGYMPPEALRDRLIAAAQGVILTPPATPSIGLRIARLLDFLLLPVVVLLLLPLLLIAAPVLIVMLRRREKADPVIAPAPSVAAIAAFSASEDHSVTNPFSAIGSLKPGAFRRWITIVILWVVNWTTRHIYTHGRLGRVGTIHFARWVFLDNERRLFFASNYDGSLEAYMDDFINKVAFGLNLVFSNGIGYPRTDWLFVGGARHDRDFKGFLRHHQIVTDVWYKAYPGLTTYDLARNSRIRAGFEQAPLTGAALTRWLAEI